MAVRFTHTFYSGKGTKYILNFHDSEFSGTAAACELRHPGFVYKLSGEGDEPDEPVKASEVSLTFDVRNSTEEAFIADIVNSAEQRFFLEICRTNTTTRWWVGVLLQDLISIPDLAYPYGVDLSFTDGLGALADIPYDNEGTLYAGRDSFVDHLVKLLGKIGHTSVWGSSDVFLETKLNYYESGHGTISGSKCPGQYSDLDYNAFKTVDSKTKDPVAISCLDALKQIAMVWGARLIMSDGRFVLEQINEMATTVPVRRFSKSGSYINYTTGSRLVSASAFTKSNGRYIYKPPVLEMKQTMQWKIGVNASNLLPEQTTFDPAVEVCYVEQNSGALDYFNFAGNLHFYSTLASPITDERRAIWGFQIAIETAGGTTYYFQNTIATMGSNSGQWLTTAGYFYVSRSIPRNTLYINVIHSMNFNTPQFPADGNVTFKFVFIRFERMQASSWVTTTWPPSSTFNWLCEDYTLTIVELTASAVSYIAGSRVYTLTNQSGGSNIKASVKRELDDVLIGDAGTDSGYMAYVSARIRTSADLVTWGNSSATGWAVNNITTSGYEINRLRLLELMVGRRLPMRVFTGLLHYASFSPTNVFTIDSVYFSINGVTFNAGDDQLQVELFNLAYSRSDYSNVAVAIDYTLEEEESNSGANNTDGPGAAMAAALNATDLLNTFLRLFSVTQTDADVSGSTTSISCYRISEAALKSGDTILLITKDWQVEEFTVSADQAADAESISVTSKTPSITIPAESLVVVRPASIKDYLNQVPRIIRTTSDPAASPAASGNIYINTATGTIWVANGTASSSNWIQVNNFD